MARQQPGDALGQLDHEPVWIEEVEGPVPPRPVHRAGEGLDAEAPEPLGLGSDVVDKAEGLAPRPAGLGIDVVDKEEALPGRPALSGLTVDQVGCTCALQEPEFRLARDELRVSRIAELEGEPESVPIERD